MIQNAALALALALSGAPALADPVIGTESRTSGRAAITGLTRMAQTSLADPGRAALMDLLVVQMGGGACWHSGPDSLGNAIDLRLCGIAIGAIWALAG